MKTRLSIRICLSFLFVVFACLVSVAPADQTNRAGWQRRSVNIRATGGLKIISVSEQEETTIYLESTPAILALTDHTVPPLAGFSPLVAIVTSDKCSSSDLDYEHILQSSYVGNPLNPPAADNFVVGVFDSGSVVDLVAGSSAVTLGLTGGNLTGNVLPLGGVGGSVDALLSQPHGFFAAGLSAVQPNGQLDTSQLMGHTNISLPVAPAISCGNGEVISAVIGTPFVSFFTAVIRNDNLQRVSVNGRSYISPDVQILDPSDPSIPVYSRKIAIEFGGPTVATTASYYGDFEDFKTPIIPTLLSLTPMSFPFGGAFFSEIGVLQGEPAPTNPIQYMRVLVDTGAQSSIMSPAMAAKLNLPVDPDFTVDVCGVAGLVQDVPGYYIDYVKINALGGAMEFSHAPFVILDLESPEGGPLDGVLGMNFFWNRNVIFDPSLSTSSFLHISEPVMFAYVDFDDDGDIDLADFAIFSAAWLTSPDDTNWDPRCDIYIDESIDIQDLAAFAEQWLLK
ncbi:MAG: retroviral-like aspartic protease family protein [Sedimentisphaerales bacterium]|nr:retroviral-like aspartic protease family protein [Sedimentisphaerales bacterium]